MKSIFMIMRFCTETVKMVVDFFKLFVSRKLAFNFLKFGHYIWMNFSCFFLFELEFFFLPNPSIYHHHHHHHHPLLLIWFFFILAIISRLDFWDFSFFGLSRKMPAKMLMLMTLISGRFSLSLSPWLSTPRSSCE